MTGSADVLFVAGWGRSGSTLLDRLLGSLHGVTSLGEMRDVCLRGGLENRLCGCGTPFQQCPFWSAVGRCAFGQQGWSSPVVAEIDQARRRLDRPWTVPLLIWPWLGSRAFRRRLAWYAGQLGELFRVTASVSGTPLLLDSSKISTHALVLRRAGLSVQVVHLVRDSRAVLWSWQKTVLRGDAGGAPEEMIRYRLVGGVVRYLMYNLMAQLLGVLTGASVRVRYEDLVAAPGSVLQQLTEQLNLPVVAADAPTFHQIAAGYLDLPAPHAVDGNPMRLQPGRLCIRSRDDGHQALPAAHRAVITAVTAPLLLAYGYRLSGRSGTGNAPK